MRKSNFCLYELKSIILGEYIVVDCGKIEDIVSIFLYRIPLDIARISQSHLE